MKAVRTAVAMAATIVAVNLAALAAEPEGWRFEITPYAWLQGLDGTLTVNGRDYGFDRDFSDLWSSVDFAAGLLGISRYDQWVALGQFDYAQLDSDNDDASRPARLEADEMFAIAAAGRQFVLSKRFDVDVMAGVRYGEIDSTVTVKPAGLDASSKVEATDAVLVLRPHTKILGNLHFNPLLYVGAGDADLVYEFQPELQYFFNRTVDLRVAYRQVHYECEEGDDAIDVNFTGMVLGLGIHF